MFARSLLLTAILLISGAAAAAEPLTRDQVGRFVSALEKLVERSERHDALSASDQQAMASDMAEEYQGIIEDHGFTMQSWSRVSERVFRALAGLEMEGADIDSKMAEARAEIRNNENLSEAQKQQMLKAIEQQEQAMSSYSDSPDRSAVAPYRDRLLQLTRDQ